MTDKPWASWTEVASELERIVAEASEPFDQDTVSNGRDFLSLVQDRCPLPDDFGKGYWSTFSFTWGRFEVEVFDDHLETYRFRDGATDVAHFARRPGEPFPADFIGQLPAPSL